MPNEYWVVTWDPPINKLTVARVFTEEAKAWKFVREHLEPSGWPMNIKVIHTNEALWGEAVDKELAQKPETD